MSAKKSYMKPKGSPFWNSLASDAKRFVLYCSQMIAEAPLRAYISAIAFAPKGSLIRQIYLDLLPRWFRQLPVPRDTWGNELFSIQSHTESIGDVQFLPDG
jgi:hypothetical protein